jgi:hypothetical protein
MSPFVPSLDNEATYAVSDPVRAFDRTGLRPGGWWCAAPTGHASDLTRLLYGDAPMPEPSFLTADERRRAADELAVLRAAGDGRAFLAAEAIDWAQRAPADPDVPEALSRSVQGWRRAVCPAAEDSDLPRRAFTALHRQYPQSEWTRRTPYWYR